MILAKNPTVASHRDLSKWRAAYLPDSHRPKSVSLANQRSLQTAELANAGEQGLAVAMESPGSPNCLVRALSLPQLQNPLHPVPAFDDTPALI
jgi:hypothetical protein